MKTTFTGTIPIKFEITPFGKKFLESIPIGPGLYGRGKEPPAKRRAPRRRKSQ